MEPNQPQSGSSDELQFDQAQFDEAAPASHQCVACHQPITDIYYAAGDKIVCPRCRDTVIAQQTGGSGFGRFVKATIAGIGAAIVGAAIYFGISWATGYEFGLVAIVVGFMVGIAVRWGSAGRGGWMYQLLAIFLTYTAIVATYVPMIYQEVLHSQEHPQAETTEVESAPESAAAAEPLSDIEKIFLFVFVCVFSFAAPFLAGLENIMGMIIIGIALYEAWKINQRQRFELLGPYSMSGNAPAGPPAPLPLPLPPKN